MEEGRAPSTEGSLMARAFASSAVLRKKLCEEEEELMMTKKIMLGVPGGLIRQIKHFIMFLEAFTGRSKLVQCVCIENAMEK